MMSDEIENDPYVKMLRARGGDDLGTALMVACYLIEKRIRADFEKWKAK